MGSKVSQRKGNIEKSRMEPELLPDSELGTKAHWDSVYATENENHDDIGDEGECWFGEEAMYRMIRKLERMCDEEKLDQTDPIIDLGTGNGVMLRELDEFGFSNLTGVDYSQASIDLARKVCNSIDGLTLRQHDLMASVKSGEYDSKFKMALDKGTFDAISLCPVDKKQSMEKYVEHVKEMLSENGHLLITSCCWSGPEFKQLFTDHFTFIEQLPTPTIKFGGKEGSNVSVLLFRRR